VRTLRVVFDSNVWISSLIASGTSKEVTQEALRLCEVFISGYILEEVDQFLVRKIGADAEERRRVRRWLEGVCRVEEDPRPNPKKDPVCRDPKDIPILRLALAVHADLLVTGDQDLLTMKELRGISIVTPSQFWHSR
jgi:putative PIN family toxin of toxin-antitoxin system